MYIHICIYMHICVYICIYIYRTRVDGLRPVAAAGQFYDRTTLARAFRYVFHAGIIYTYLCVYIYIYIVYICNYIHILIHIYVSTCIYIVYICMCSRFRWRIQRQDNTCVRSPTRFSRRYIYIYIYMYIYICVCVCMYV